MSIRKLLGLTSLLEAATGLALMIYPSPVVRLLFGAEISGVGLVISRVTGICLIALGLGCWPKGDGSSSRNGAARGMLTYNLLATVYFVYLGIGGEWVGILLWPAVLVHAVITILFARAWYAIT